MRHSLAFVALTWAIASGCSAGRVPNVNQSLAQAAPLDGGPKVEYGRPHRFVDGLGWVVGIPEKIALWDRRASNHSVSTETEQSLTEYLAANGMESTKVRINQYDPGGEWQRLAANKSVGAGWRYTFGALHTLGYTILPGRVFSGFVGGDSYNPYTDSIYVYSDIPALALEQGAHAKNVRWRSYPGFYATAYSLPLLSLFPEKAAKSEVYSYVAINGDYDEQLAARDVLYPQFGSEIGGQVALLGPGPTLPLTLAGAGAGHLVDALAPAPLLGRDPFAAKSTPMPEVAQTAAVAPAQAESPGIKAPAQASFSGSLAPGTAHSEHVVRASSEEPTIQR